MRLSKQEMRDETGYQIAAYLARKMLKEGLITEDEYRVICTKLLAVFPAIIGTLLSQK